MEIEEEKKIRKTSKRLDYFIFWTVMTVKFLIGFWYCVIVTIPFAFILHLYYIQKYGSFLVFTMWDVYLLTISNIIFWLRMYFKK
jgi:hypothetical protein